MDHERLGTVNLPVATSWADQPLSALALHAMQVRVVSVRRSHGESVPVTEQTLLQGGDTLVWSGTPQALAMAEQKLFMQ
jgi:CPA2 family monovalent cation:H+ antiporter-2